jgi:hypothetical protein
MTFLRTIAIALLLNLPVHAQPHPTASDAWAAPASNGSLAIYATVNNPSMYDVYLVSGSSDAAGTIELISGDKPASSITVPAYESVDLKPGGYFVRLSDLTGQPQAGDEVKLTLLTDGGIAIAIAAVVK